MRSTFAVRETQSLGQQMLNAPLGFNGLMSSGESFWNLANRKIHFQPRDGTSLQSSAHNWISVSFQIKHKMIMLKIFLLFHNQLFFRLHKNVGPVLVKYMETHPLRTPHPLKSGQIFFCSKRCVIF